MDNLIDRIDWELRRELASAPMDVKHYAGVARCVDCGHEERVLLRAPEWAFTPLPSECSLCQGFSLLVHPKVPVPQGQEPYNVIIVNPKER